MRSNCLITFYAHTHNTHLARFQSVGDRFIPLSAFFYKQLSQLLFFMASQKLYLALCKYQRSISACNDQFVPLVALIIYIREYYICTYICVYVHALIMLLFIICVGCCAHFCFSLPQTTIFS